MDKDQIIVRCLNCGTKNRITKEHINDRPTCGKCHAPLDEMIIHCLHCGTKNRMPENRLDDRPLCGKCGSALVIDGSSGAPVDVMDASFSRDVTEAAGIVLVDCWAPWCAPCRMVAPILDELAQKYAGRVKIAKLNVDENPQTSARFEVRSIPTMLLFRDGNLVDRLVGALPAAEIERKLLGVLQTK